MAFLDQINATEERKRIIELDEGIRPWHKWGPYLSERQWGTVREDYSDGGTAWDYFPHDHARSRTYRWGEDGIAGLSDSHQRLCFALAMWNGQDGILKERLFGLTGSEGNHGEDVKEYYYYLDSTPTNSYMKYLYRYPQAAFPYAQLLDVNRSRGRQEPEYELVDTGVFNEDRYFDVFVEYVKQTAEDILIVISAVNHGPEAATLTLLPTLWFRNTWSWGYPDAVHPSLRLARSADGVSVIETSHPELGSHWLYSEGADEMLFTENETDKERFGWGPNPTPYVKDSFHKYVIQGDAAAVNPERTGTKAAVLYRAAIPPGETKTFRLRLCNDANLTEPFGKVFDYIVDQRKKEADDFYRVISPEKLSDEQRMIQRQAFAGMIWSKQYYYYVVKDWLDGDPAGPPPPDSHRFGRNSEWAHMYNADVFSMPDKWEYPWYAAWDLAFHTVVFAIIDPRFAKRQLYILTREWYMHPNGQFPAYEWAFGDVNPVVQGAAALFIYTTEKRLYGVADIDFLKLIFHKMLLYFSWWVNKKDAEGNNIYQGGFLGMDNISLFDRSSLGIAGAQLDQADGTSWMALFCNNMLRIAVEIAQHDSTYQEWVGKFLQQFLYIADAMNFVGGRENLWDEEDGFYYDVLRIGDEVVPLKVRTMVGLIPIAALAVIDVGALSTFRETAYTSSRAFSDFQEYFQWFLVHRPDLTRHENVAVNAENWQEGGQTGTILLSLVSPERLKRILAKMLDENEFLSPYGIRSLSKYHEDHPVTVNLGGVDHTIRYEPAESSTGMFGGNSNWRGPIWMPVNFLLIEVLLRYYYHLGDAYTVEFPTGSGNYSTLLEVAIDLGRRLMKIFEQDEQGRRPVFGGAEKFQTDPSWNDKPLFYEYFHGDNGAGVGASHQTGWTGLIAFLMEQWAGGLR